MKLRTMLYGLTLMLGCFVLAACVNDEEGPCLPDGKIQVLFSLELQDNAQTRAGDETWNGYDPKDPGVEYDNFIDLGSVQMLLFKADGGENDGKYVGKLDIQTYTQSGENKYQYIGTAPPGLEAGVKYKFVVLANCNPVKPEPKNLDDLADLTFTYSTMAHIPMWGTKDVTLTLEAGSRQDIQDIYLLRAMSKVTVALTGESGDLHEYDVISSVKVTRHNKEGYVVPTGYNTATTTATTVLYLDNSLNEKKTTYSEGEDPSKTFTGTAKELTFYLMEYDNSKDKAAELIVTLAKTDADGVITESKEYSGAPIQFCEYVKEGDNKGIPDTSKPYNIVRNHYYQFNIFKVTERSLYVKPMVLPWDVKSEFDYASIVEVSLRTGNNSQGVGISYLRYDTDGNFESWDGSYVAVANGTGDSGAATYSPYLVLSTTSNNDLFLQLDNPKFEFIQFDGTQYNHLGAGNPLNIPAKIGANGKPESVTTNFYVMPAEPYDPIAKPSRECYMSLISSGGSSAAARVPLRSSLPGFGSGVDEVWFFWVSADDYTNAWSASGAVPAKYEGYPDTGMIKKVASSEE